MSAHALELLVKLAGYYISNGFRVGLATVTADTRPIFNELFAHGLLIQHGTKQYCLSDAGIQWTLRNQDHFPPPTK